MTDQAPSLTRIKPHIAEIRLRRAGTANRLTPGDLEVLSGFLDEINADPGVHVIILAANGAAFSAGFDLGSLTSPDRTTRTDGRTNGRGENAFERLANKLAASRPITIAAIQGAVVGGATDLALACDLRIGAEAASLLMPAARIGLPLYASALDRYVSRLGIDTAKRLIFLGQRISSGEMARIGFLTELVADDALAGRLLALADDLASLPPQPLAAMKIVLNGVGGGEARSPAMRAVLDAAFDPVVIQQRVAAQRANRPTRT